MSRLQRFTLLAAILVIVGQASAWVMDALAPDFHHFWRFIVFYAGIKLLGDMVYFVLWPERRQWTFFSIYFLDDFVLFFRFGFPAAVIQRIVQTQIYPPYIYDAPAHNFTHQIVAGPYAAIAVYLVNRWLIEEASETRYRQARNFLHLP